MSLGISFLIELGTVAGYKDFTLMHWLNLSDYPWWDRKKAARRRPSLHGGVRLPRRRRKPCRTRVRR